MRLDPHINDIIQSWANLGFKTTAEAREFIVANKDWKDLIRMNLGNTAEVDAWRLREIEYREFDWVRRIV